MLKDENSTATVDKMAEISEDGSAFVNVGKAVMRGEQCIAVACSKTMAKRIARALNRHQVNSEGV